MIFALSAWLALVVPAFSADIFYRTHKDGWTWLYIVGKIVSGDDITFKARLLEAAGRGMSAAHTSSTVPGG